MSGTSHQCAHQGCERNAPRAVYRSPGDRYCTRHDGADHGLGVCTCLGARADGIGQCVQCWHPVIALHRGLAPLLGRLPWLANQVVVAA